MDRYLLHDHDFRRVSCLLPVHVLLLTLLNPRQFTPFCFYFYFGY